MKSKLNALRIEANRKLVPFEQLFEHYNRHSSSFILATTSCVTGALTKELIQQALDLIQLRHPRLNARIVGFPHRLRFKSGGVSSLPLRVVRIRQPSEWQNVLEEELNTKLESDRWLLRATLIHINDEPNTHYLITTIHHAIADGASSVQLHSEILSYCQSIAAGKQVVANHLPILPAIHRLFPKPFKGLRGGAIGTLFFFQALWQILRHRSQHLSCEQQVPIHVGRKRVIHRQLDAALVKKLVQACKVEQTTVQGALGAAMLLAVVEKISRNKAKKTRVSCLSAVSLRPRVQPPVDDQQVSWMSSSVPSFHYIQPTSNFWDIARDVKQQLDDGIHHNNIFKLLLIGEALIKLFCNPSIFSPSDFSVTLTNLGRSTIPKTYGEFELKAISYLAAPASTTFYAAAITFDGTMFLNFPYSVPFVSQSTIESLIDRTLFFLTQVC
jgi:hypothetical protein